MTAAHSLGLRIIAGLLLTLNAVIAVADGGVTTTPPSATELSLDINIALGFSGIFKLGQWTPLTITVSNNGRTRSGTLEVEVPNTTATLGERTTTLHRRGLELAPGARKRFRFTVFLDSFAHPLHVSVHTAGHATFTQKIALRRAFTESAMLVVMSRDANLDYLNARGEHPVRVLYPRMELLPDRWQGYLGVHAVVIHDVSLEDLSGRQFTALKKWLAQGGRVLISGTANYALLNTPRLAELLPARAAGTLKVNGTALNEAFTKLPTAKGAFSINRLDVVYGHVLRVAGSTPLVVEQARGRGKVVYFTFDVARYPFAEWSGMTRLWHDYLDLSSHPLDTTERASGEHPLLAAIKTGAHEFPAHGTVIAFLALYLCVLGMLYRVRQRHVGASRVQRRLILPIVAAPLVFGIGAFALFGPLLFPSGARAVLLSVIEPFANSDYASVVADIGLYANKDHTLRLVYSGVEPSFKDIEPHTRDAALWVHETDHELSIAPEAARKFQLYAARGQDIVLFPLQAHAEKTAQDSELTIVNQTGAALADTWFVADGIAYALGTVAAGEERSFALSKVSTTLALGTDPWRALVKANSAAHSAKDSELMLKRAFRNFSASLQNDGRHALLLGFTTGPLKLPSQQEWVQQHTAMVALPVAWAFPTTNGAIQEPPQR